MFRPGDRLAQFIFPVGVLRERSGIIRAFVTQDIREADMASYSTSEFKSGLKIMLDGEPYNIVENEFVKPGKGQAFNRVKVKNLKNGRVIEKTFKSGEKVDGADVMDTTMQYLYSDGEYWHFMDEATYEQVQADAMAVGDSSQWLKEQDTCNVILWDGVPIS